MTSLVDRAVQLGTSDAGLFTASEHASGYALRVARASTVRSLVTAGCPATGEMITAYQRAFLDRGREISSCACATL